MHTPQTLRALTLTALLGATFAAHALPTDCKQPWPPAPQATASVTLNEGCSPLRQMLNPQPLPPRRGGAEVAKLNPQPLPPEAGETARDTDASRADSGGFGNNPPPNTADAAAPADKDADAAGDGSDAGDAGDAADGD